MCIIKQGTKIASFTRSKMLKCSGVLSRKLTVCPTFSFSVALVRSTSSLCLNLEVAFNYINCSLEALSLTEMLMKISGLRSSGNLIGLFVFSVLDSIKLCIFLHGTNVELDAVQCEMNLKHLY